MGRGPNAPTSAWTLVGPSTANFPDVLTFSERLTRPPVALPRSPSIRVATSGGAEYGREQQAAESCAQTTLYRGAASTGYSCQVALEPMRSERLPIRAAFFIRRGREANALGDSAAGVGIYKSADGGNTWTALNATIGPITTFSPGTGTNGTYGPGNAFLGRSISSIVVDPTNASHLYVLSSRGVRGVSSVTAAELRIHRRRGRRLASSNRRMAARRLGLSGMVVTIGPRRAMEPTPKQPFAEPMR